MKGKIAVIVNVLILLCTCIYAQNGSIAGTVIEENGEGIPFANIALIQETNILKGTQSDFDGHFLIDDLVPGEYDIKVSYVGKNPVYIQNISVSDDERRTIDVTMTSEVHQLECVTISCFKMPLVEKQSSSKKQTITQEQISVLPTRNVNNIVSQTADVYFGGGRNNSNNYYIDGVKVRGSVQFPSSSVTTKTSKKKKTKSSHNVITEQVQVTSMVGKITATEINDFSKWELWTDIQKDELAKYQSVWNIIPDKRYAVQLLSEGDMPLVDVEIQLLTHSGELIWTARSDNTGKAELWGGIFTGIQGDSLKISLNISGELHDLGLAKPISQGYNIHRLDLPCDNPDIVDIAFVVDATSSMSDEISFLKSDLLNIIEGTHESLPGVDIRLASVFYRSPTDAYVVKHKDFSKNHKTIMKFIDEQFASGGGDESVELAFQDLIYKLDWSKHARSRMVFWILDQQPLTDAKTASIMQDCIQKAAEMGIRVIPVVASAEDPYNAKSLEYLMRSIALATNGTSLFLTDHSGIGNAHVEPTTDEMDISTLNMIMNRLIYSFSYIPDCRAPVEEPPVSDTLAVDTSGLLLVANSDLLKLQLDTCSTKMDSFSVNNKDSKKKLKSKNKESQKLKLFPNPCAGVLNVKQDGKVEELLIFDLSGKLVHSSVIKDQQIMQIDLGMFSSGQYLASYFLDGKLISEQLVLLSR